MQKVEDNIIDLVDLAKKKYGSQAKCAKAMNWDRRRLNKIMIKKVEAKVSDINAIAKVLDISVSDVVNFLSN